MSVTTDEHGLIHVPDWEARGKALLLWQHADKARINAFVAAMAAGAQLLENTIFAVLIGASTIDGAEGVNLERWGAIVGEYRGGLDEETYRKFIDLRIRVNSEFPSFDNMWEVLDTSLPDGSELSSYTVADGIIYEVMSEVFIAAPLASHTGALIRDFRPLGIYAAIVEQQEDSEIEIGTIASPGSLIGSIAAPGGLIGRLIYDGRSRRVF